MGNFYGHLIPGLFFIVFGTWWTIQIWKKYLKSFTKYGQSFRCELCPPVQIKGRNINVEAILVVVFTVIGILIELRHVYLGGNIGMARTQHGTMYIFFLVIAILKLLNPRLRLLIPNIESIEYLLLVISLSVEALLFYFHLMERDLLNTTVHVLLVYTIYGCIALTVAEMIFRNQVLLGLGRAYFILLQGTWFCQVGFILYSPIPGYTGVYNNRWDHHNHEHIMLTTCIFCWHLGGVFLFSLASGIGWACFYRRKGELELSGEGISHGYTRLITHAGCTADNNEIK